MDSFTANSQAQATTEQAVCPAASIRLDGVRAPERGTVSWDILNAMQNGTRLTPLAALQQFNCMSLSQRVGELKRSGWPILSRTISLPSGKRVSEYWMGGVPMADELRDDYPLREASFR